eukprot:235111-Chlamydomonas_euryale.AAC.1
MTAMAVPSPVILVEKRRPILAAPNSPIPIYACLSIHIRGEGSQRDMAQVTWYMCTPSASRKLQFAHRPSLISQPHTAISQRHTASSESVAYQRLQRACGERGVTVGRQTCSIRISA